jgi:Raf kinase inhibitor-like YbhB/YbcL family protein
MTMRRTFPIPWSLLAIPMVLCLVVFGASCNKDEEEVEPTPIVDEGPPPTAETLPSAAEKVASVPGADTEGEDDMPMPAEATNLRLTSAAFSDGAAIPKKYTDDGEDVSPPLRWTEPPEGTQSFALVADDPDAPRGTWVHWVAYGIPASVRELPEGVPAEERIPQGGVQGRNDFDRLGYGGPAPPPGKPHRYFFKLYALDFMPDLPAGQTKAEVMQAIEDHVLAETQLMGTYGR